MPATVTMKTGEKIEYGSATGMRVNREFLTIFAGDKAIAAVRMDQVNRYGFEEKIVKPLRMRGRKARR